MKIIFAIVLCTLIGSVQAQKRCGTHSPEAGIQYLNFDHAQNQAKTQSTGVQYVIPTVFHVLHDGNPATVVDSVPAERIHSMMEALWRDFRNLPGNLGHGYAPDMQIHFDLATKDPQGNPTSGIEYIVDPTYLNIPDIYAAQDTIMKNKYNWPADKYCNVYLTTNIEGNAVGGYAFYPTSPLSRDAVVMDNQYIDGAGALGPASHGRLAAHEFGHWLYLIHPFDVGCDSDSSDQETLADTPPEPSPTWGTIIGRQNRCSNDMPDLPEHNKNPMAYLDERYSGGFTNDQKKWAIAALNSSEFGRRVAIWQESNLQATGTGKYKMPEADFYPKQRYICSGTPLEFYDMSKGQPSGSLELSCGSPASSMAQSPSVTYSTPGVYNVTLTVTNNAGSDDTVKTAVVVVLPATKTVPYTVGFETGETVDYHIVNHDSGRVDLPNPTPFTWEYSALGGGFQQSNRMMRIRYSQYADHKERDGIMLPPLTVNSNEANLSVAFSWVYTPYNFGDDNNTRIDYNDSMKVWASTDCGQTWEIVHETGGLDFSTTGTSSTSFISVSNFGSVPWKRDTISLNNYLNSGTLRLKLESTNGFGHDIYLDDVSIEYVAGKQGLVSRKLHKEANISLYPNPANSTFRLTGFSSIAEITVINALGQHLVQQTAVEGEQIDISHLPAGSYSVLISQGASVSVEHLVKF